MAKNILKTCRQQLTRLSKTKKVTLFAMIGHGDDVQEVICTPNQHYIVTEQQHQRLSIGLRNHNPGEKELVATVVMLMKMAVFNHLQHELLDNLLEHIAGQNELPPEELFSIINNSKDNVENFFHNNTNGRLH